jgi:twitching motility protein PilT
MEAISSTKGIPRTVELMHQALALQASDLHLTVGYPPMARIHGNMHNLSGQVMLQQHDLVEMISEIITPEQRRRLDAERSFDFTWGIDQNRFRTNIAIARTGYQMCIRIIPIHIPSAEDLLLPVSVTELSKLKRGLVLVTGPAGSGKSTTLACLLDMINHSRAANIITVEDPIEFIYPTRRAMVSQREIGAHAPTFERALRDALRQDPDVVMIGEMRDLETISSAITVAETGHLVFGTLHSYDAASAVDRIIDVFPARQQQQIRIQLANVLRAVVAQTLVPSKHGARVAAREVLIVNSAISNLIRQARTHEIPSAIEMGINQGMINMDRAIQELVRLGHLDPESAPKTSKRPIAGA